ncbi:MFS transporter [Teichococcus cervicalis]|uniref:Transporter, major facilitator family protein n=1 Tax=Pseudoroseomonas cervicalis ATCC 49957 TaxID=525371 RepID=D5RNK6_9PROT|nr:MFS transporter [Pseudoroseomonas cervicalis]EFH11112.1 transporter, major facilitator family protein [Pseudoroseomonas cervicalis ATCC 49957]
MAAEPRTARRALDALNFFLADVRDGLGPYLAIWLTSVQGWDQGGAGAVLALGGVAGLLAKGPAGVLVDALPEKRLLVVGTAIAVTLACALILVAPGFWPVAISQVLSGMAAAAILPALAALTLGVVGQAGFDARMGRNEAFNHAGNAFAAATAGGLSLYFGPVVVFWLLGGMALGSILSALAVPAAAVDPQAARGLAEGQVPAHWRDLLADRRLAVLALGCAMFHFANAPMLPLVGQKLAMADPARGTALVSACIVAAQVVMIGTSILAGRKAGIWGRKTLFLAGFLVLPLRGVLYTLSDNAAWLVGVQLLDGIGAGLFGVLLPLMVADLTRGTGHFGAALGITAVVQGLGAASANALAGWVAARFGFDAAFLLLAGSAAIGVVVFALAMPETRPDPRLPPGAQPA